MMVKYKILGWRHLCNTSFAMADFSSSVIPGTLAKFVGSREMSAPLVKTLGLKAILGCECMDILNTLGLAHMHQRVLDSR